jgi:hypothetical protein
MSTYYEFKGALTFASPKDATAAHERLRGLDFFWTPEPATAKDLVVTDATLTFASEGFGGDYETFIDARIALRELASQAKDGRVRVQAGDGGPGTEVDFFGFKPKKKPADGAKKSATKKTATKKSAKKS